ncbi:hypothetical protein B0H19DRAFT_1260012 [Mycena capillaripes]|nr:hypothetical protein B0H19DRAFT_1260012 [Mycena capillaripes]
MPAVCVVNLSTDDHPLSIQNAFAFTPGPPIRPLLPPMTTNNDSVDAVRWSFTPNAERPAGVDVIMPRWVRSLSICSTVPSLVIILPESSASTRLTAYTSNREARLVLTTSPDWGDLQMFRLVTSRLFHPRPAPRLQQDTPLPNAMRRTRGWTLEEMYRVQRLPLRSCTPCPRSSPAYLIYDETNPKFLYILPSYRIGPSRPRVPS